MTLPLELGQTLLLAAFAPRDEALAAWDLWERSSNWQDHVEFDAYLLLLGSVGAQQQLAGSRGV